MTRFFLVVMFYVAQTRAISNFVNPVIGNDSYCCNVTTLGFRASINSVLGMSLVAGRRVDEGDKNGHAAGQTTELRGDSGYSGQDSSIFGSCLGTAGVRVVGSGDLQQGGPNAYIILSVGHPS
ncbi:hypothetical protein EDB83DRAFT_2547254 [Lactarius deliciosus]|nr:hypothetical protein EDB83DRAFT_2547254 [Lactarius deliciosus]